MTNENTQVPTKLEATESRVFRPRLDLLEHAERYVLRVDVPGAKAEAVDVTFEDGVLTIDAPVAPRREAHATDEYSVGDWHVAIRFDDSIAPEGVEASQSRGVLQVVLPKAQARRQRRIEVSAN